VPLVVRYDPLTADKRGTLSQKFALNIDLAPTFAELAGVSAPGADGLSLLPLLRDPTAPWRSDFLVEHAGGGNGVPAYCSVHGYFANGQPPSEYVYVQYSTGEEELYNLDADPYELQNQASNPDYEPIRQQMDARAAVLCNPLPPTFTGPLH
jgi:N-acetylglucosamine-6-sulfatase